MPSAETLKPLPTFSVSEPRDAYRLAAEADLPTGHNRYKPQVVVACDIDNQDRLSVYTGGCGDRNVIRGYRQTIGQDPSVTSVYMNAGTTEKLAADLAARVGYKLVPKDAKVVEPAKNTAKNYLGTSPADLREDAKATDEAASIIVGAFVWSKTPEGEDFWTKAYDGLRREADAMRAQAQETEELSAPLAIAEAALKDAEAAAEAARKAVAELRAGRRKAVSGRRKAA